MLLFVVFVDLISCEILIVYYEYLASAKMTPVLRETCF